MGGGILGETRTFGTCYQFNLKFKCKLKFKKKLFLILQEMI